jgi:1,4-dihydroxy-2-naphthoate octaprenyltransferase
MQILPPFSLGRFSFERAAHNFCAVRQNGTTWLTVATVARFYATILLVSDRGERKFLWFLVIVVGLALCAFGFTHQNPAVPLIFIPLGIFLIVWGVVRIRRLGKRRSKLQKIE